MWSGYIKRYILRTYSIEIWRLGVFPNAVYGTKLLRLSSLFIPDSKNIGKKKTARTTEFHKTVRFQFMWILINYKPSVSDIIFLCLKFVSLNINLNIDLNKCGYVWDKVRPSFVAVNFRESEQILYKFYS